MKLDIGVVKVTNLASFSLKKKQVV